MLLNDIKQEIKDFESQSIQIVDGLFFNQKETIEKIFYYYNSKFISGDIDTEGDKKYFYNINRNPCRVTTKAIDFDTKHVNMQTAGGGDTLKTWYFERDLKFWMKDQNFGKTLNRIFSELPRYGSVVLKIINGTPYFVDLRNFVVEQASDTLDNSDYIIEKHNYVPAEFRRVGKELGWKNIEETIFAHREMDEPYIVVYERYGEVRELDANGKATYTGKRIYMADVGINTYNEGTRDWTPYKGFTLKEDELKGNPYWEFHMNKIPGRWLGVGVVETLFDAQVRQNELANQEAKSTYWSSLRLFQTSDTEVNRNLRTDVRTGDVLNSESPITQIDMTEKNMSYFVLQTDKWLRNRDELTFAYEVMRGERLPAGTPLGSARLAAGMAGGHFDQIREDIALRVKELLYDVIIPQFQKENTKEHSLRLVGEDLDAYNELLIASKAKMAMLEFVGKSGKLPTSKHYETIKAAIGEQVKQGTERIQTIPKDFYKNIKYKIDIIITGEAKDTAVYSQTLFAILQAITADPTITTDPVKRKIFGKIAESGGVNINDILMPRESSREQLMAGQPMPRAGGGVSRPAFAPAGQGATASAEQKI